jgi:hypothetical protein
MGQVEGFVQYLSGAGFKDGMRYPDYLGPAAQSCQLRSRGERGALECCGGCAISSGLVIRGNSAIY